MGSVQLGAFSRAETDSHFVLDNPISLGRGNWTRFRHLIQVELSGSLVIYTMKNRD